MMGTDELLKTLLLVQVHESTVGGPVPQVMPNGVQEFCGAYDHEGVGYMISSCANNVLMTMHVCLLLSTDCIETSAAHVLQYVRLEQSHDRCFLQLLELLLNHIFWNVSAAGYLTAAYLELRRHDDPAALKAAELVEAFFDKNCDCQEVKQKLNTFRHVVRASLPASCALG